MSSPKARTKLSTHGLLPPMSVNVPMPNAGFALRSWIIRRVQCSRDELLRVCDSTLVTW